MMGHQSSRLNELQQKNNNCGGGIGRRTIEREKVAEPVGENHVRCKSLPTFIQYDWIS